MINRYRVCWSNVVRKKRRLNWKRAKIASLPPSAHRKEEEKTVSCALILCLFVYNRHSILTFLHRQHQHPFYFLLSFRLLISIRRIHHYSQIIQTARVERWYIRHAFSTRCIVYVCAFNLQCIGIAQILEGDRLNKQIYCRKQQIQACEGVGPPPLTTPRLEQP